MSILTRLALAATTILTPTIAFAHTGIGPTAGSSRGFLHPIGDLDRVLTIVLVDGFAR